MGTNPVPKYFCRNAFPACTMVEIRQPKILGEKKRKERK